MLHHLTRYEGRRKYKGSRLVTKERKEMFTFVLCKCSHKIKFKKPAFLDDSKAHSVCPRCNLHWHLDMNGKTYSHIWKLGDKDVHNLKSQLAKKGV